MKTVYYFNKKEGISDDFSYALSPLYSNKYDTVKKFREYDEFISNFELTDTAERQKGSDYEYISLISRKKYSSGVKVSLKCSFEKFGAPLIVLCDDFSKREDGIELYNLHFEVVAFESGCNVWHIIPFWENRQWPIKGFKAGFSEFELKSGEIVDITVEVKGKYLHIDVNGNKFVCCDPEIPENFRVGFTACEGKNKIYSFSVEE